MQWTCHFCDATFWFCGKIGHIAHACHSKPAQNSPGRARPHQTSCIQKDPDVLKLQALNLPMYNKDQIYVSVQIKRSPCKMHLDTKSLISIISTKTLRKLCLTKVPTLRLAPFVLRDLQKNAIALKGVGTLQVKFKIHTQNLDLSVTEWPYTSLLGMSWFQPFGIRVTGRNQTSTVAPDFKDICAAFPAVFDGQLGFYNGPPVTLQLDSSVHPICGKARQVPFFFKPKIDEELDQLIEQGVLETVAHGVWETPFITSIKPNGSIRICGNYKCTLN